MQLGHGRDLAPARDATHALQVGHQHIGRALFQQARAFANTEIGFAGGDVHRRALPHLGTTRDVLRIDRLFEPPHVERSDRMRHAQRLLRLPLLVGIDDEFAGGSDGTANGTETLEVLRKIVAQLELVGRVPKRREPGSLCHEFLRVELQ